jgi:hypothetical protein
MTMSIDFADLYRLAVSDLHTIAIAVGFQPTDKGVTPAAILERVEALVEERRKLMEPVEGVDVGEVLRLDREATPGPWGWDDGIGDWCKDRLLHMAPISEVVVPEWNGVGEMTLRVSPHDAALIAVYRTAAPSLAREVACLRARLAEVEAERDAARAEAEALRFTLAAEQGKAEGAPFSSPPPSPGSRQR